MKVKLLNVKDGRYDMNDALSRDLDDDDDVDDDDDDDENDG